MKFLSPKILIYDKTDYLTKLVKHYCGESIEVTFHNENRRFDSRILNSIDIAYLKSNDDNDLEEIMLIHEHVKQLNIDTNSKKIKSKTQQLSNIVFFDTEKDRFEIMTQIFNYTNELNRLN